MYAPNSYGGPKADPDRAAEVHWYTDGDMVQRVGVISSLPLPHVDVKALGDVVRRESSHHTEFESPRRSIGPATCVIPAK